MPALYGSQLEGHDHFQDASGCEALDCLFGLQCLREEGQMAHRPRQDDGTSDRKDAQTNRSLIVVRAVV